MEQIDKENQILIYKAKDGKFAVDVKLKGETVWLTQKQIARLFDVERSVITKHIRNIFKQNELDKNLVSAKFAHTAEDGKSYQTVFYNLDIIISVGYRVNSARATQFRIWATKILQEYLINGYSLNQKRLNETGLIALESALEFIQSTISRKQLTNQETKGLLEVITRYAKSWLLLKRYDDHEFPSIKGHKLKCTISYEYALKAVHDLKVNLIEKKEAADIFGCERENSLEAILGNLEQTFGGKLLYSTIEEKAAHLIYFVIKDHPFIDGNKRIASLLFILYLDKNCLLFKQNGELIINDNTIVALALLIAESDPKNKDLLIGLVTNLLKSNG